MQCTILPQDISQKMSDSIFCYRKEPFWVHSIAGTQVGLVPTVGHGGDYAHKISYNDPELDFASIPLGYVNYQDYEYVTYLQRIPVRKVKQGVNQGNTRMMEFPPSEKSLGRPYNLDRVFASKGFYNMVMDKYPSLEEALKKLRNGGKNIAISRSIALNIDEQDIIRVFYKNNYVGWIQPNKSIVHVKTNELGWVVSKYLSHILGWQID